jgi:hypothetical protein
MFLRKCSVALVVAMGLSVWTLPASRGQSEAGGPQQPDLALTETFEGTIVAIDAAQVTISIAGDQKRFAIADDVMILLNGAEASLDELKPGYLATIMAESDGDQLIAKVIDAQLQK